MTEEFVRYAIAGYEALTVRIREVAIQIATIQDTTRNPTDDYVDFYFEDGKLYAKFEYYCYGDTDQEYVHIPLEYLWTDFVEIEKTRYAAERAEAIRLAKEKEVREAAARQTQKEQQEWATFLRLKEKFKDVPERQK